MSLCLTLILGLVTPAHANEGNVASTQQMLTNEFDLYNAIICTPEATLLEQGYTSAQIEIIKATDFEDLIYQRAKLADSKLKAMGYSEEEICLLQNYSGSYAETRALAGTLSAEINCYGASPSGFIICYEWSWDHSPFVVATDAMGMRWIALGQDGATVDVSANLSVARIYYNDANITTRELVYHPSDSNFSSETSFNALSCTFPMKIGQGEQEWFAESGFLHTFVSKDSGITRDIYYLKVSGVYGHTIFNIGAPTVSFGPGEQNVGISFTGGLNTDNLGIKKYRIYTDGRKVPFEA